MAATSAKIHERKKRSANFTKNDRENLLLIIESRKSIIENKKTDAVTISQKNFEWDRITSEFNASCPDVTPRTVESLRKYYNNQKEGIRKKLSKSRSELYRTGGGPNLAEGLNEKAGDNILLSIVNQKTLHGLDDSIAHFDSDYIAPRTVPDVNSQQTEFGTFENSSKVRKFFFKQPLDPKLYSVIERCESQNNSSITRNDAENIETTEAEENFDLTNNNNTPSVVFDIDDRATYNDYQSSLPTEIQGQFSNSSNFPSPATTPIRRQGVKRDSDGLTANQRSQSNSRSSKRRPTIIKTLSSSVLAERYEKLLDTKMSLLNNLEKEHQIRMETLDIEKNKKLEQLKILKSRSLIMPRSSSSVDVDKEIGESIDFTL